MTYIICIYFKLNSQNTLVTISKYKYNNYKLIFIKILKTLSCGYFKSFKNRLKNTFLAHNILIITIIKYLINKKFINVYILFNGINFYRIHILKLLLNITYKQKKLHICKLFDVTNISYNGCKLAKKKYI